MVPVMTVGTVCGGAEEIMHQPTTTDPCSQQPVDLYAGKPVRD